MEVTQSQKDKIAAAKKKLRRFQQKSSRLEKNVNGSQSEQDAESLVSQQSDMALHQQTIDILVEEKTDLLRSRDRLTTDIQQLNDEISVLKSQLHSTSSDLSSSEKKRSTLTNQLNSAVLESEERGRERERLRGQVTSLNEHLDLLQTELSTLSLERDQLSSKLSSSSSDQPQVRNNMSAVANPFKKNEELTKLVIQLQQTEVRMEEVRGTLSAKEMQCDTLAGRLSHQDTVFKEQIRGLQKQLQSKESCISALENQISELAAAKDDIPLTRNSESTSVSEISEVSDLRTDPTTPTAPSVSTPPAAEREKLEKALEEQIIQTLQTQKELARYKETHVNQNTLLTEINNNKATISRAMGQNRQLKDHMLELQDKLMKTSETNAHLANEVQELSAQVSHLLGELARAQEREGELSAQLKQRGGAALQRPLSEDSLLESGSSRAKVSELNVQIRSLNQRVASIQQEKAILGLSVAQVDSVKAMNVALQEKVASLSKQLDSGKTSNELALEERLARLEKDYTTEAVDKRFQDMQNSERSEREKQRAFLDNYYEEHTREQVATLEERVSSQTRQFKQYVTELQTGHEDEVEALRTQLSDLQHNFRTSLHTQYNQLVQYFTSKGEDDLKSRETELHSHYMAELGRLYNEMTKQLQEETAELRERKRTQSDDISVYTVEEGEEEGGELESECAALQTQLEQLEEEIVRVETGVEEGEEEEGDNSDDPSTTKEERRLQAHVRVLEMQLERAASQNERGNSRYKLEIVRLNQVIQKMHMYLATASYEERGVPRTVVKYDSEVHENGDDSASVTSASQFSVTSAGQFERGDLSATRDLAIPEKVKEEAESEILKSNMQKAESEFENKLQNLVVKSADSGEYTDHMQKLQSKFAVVMRDNANLYEKLKDMEHQNLLLEGETDTIGEYISLYQTQRKALRLQFQQKDDFINKLLNERADMQAHTSRLQQLITDLPCTDEPPEDPVSVFGRPRSNSITSNVSTISIMSTTRDEMLEIIGKLKLRTDKGTGNGPVNGPRYPGSHRPIRQV